MASSDRGQWSSRFGFILAAAGSAIGLGNIWRFPYSAGEGGGGIFVLLYLFFVIAIGIPVQFAELSVGRTTKRNPVGAFKALAPKSLWPIVGGLGVLTGFGILAFYSVIAGWTVGYLYQGISGGLASITTGEQSVDLFTQITTDPLIAIGLTAVFLVLTVLVVRGGVSGGIERIAKVLMPVLFALLVVLAITAMTLPGGMDGVAYLFAPDFSELSLPVVMSALGQALFSLSLGMGAMITYGSYFPDDANLWQSGVLVGICDTVIAILAGLIIFPALFSQGMDPQGGPGLVFVTLPTIFSAMPAGQIVGTAFYFLLAIAALTSTISLLEVVVCYFVDERGWSRTMAAWVLGGVCLVLAVPSALSQGAVPALGANGIFGAWDFLTLNNNIWGNYSLSIGAIMICLFVGWKWGIPKAMEALELGNHPMPATSLWGFLVKFVCPIAVFIVLVFIIVSGQYF
ncbi:MAG: sodium-dependent transporter [Rhodothermaceae bacterium]|nr:sodium-dependent transporter [Rhodothermaceae bacterium]